MKSYALIGDIHSQGPQFAKALDFCRENGLTPVLLGDLFDSRCSTSSSIYVYHLARLAEKELGAVILQSNHHDRLVDLLKERDLSTYKETLRTYDEFMKDGFDFDELEKWLCSLPHAFVFTSSDKKTYACAHAYFPESLLRDQWTPYTINVDYDTDPNSAHQKLVEGLPRRNGKRRLWWKEKSNRDFVMVAGHYHTVHIDDKSIVLDGNCGFENGFLPVFVPNTHNLVHF